MMLLWAGLAAYGAAQAADMWTTVRALRLGHREGWPPMAWIMRRAPMAWPAIKAALGAGSAWMLFKADAPLLMWALAAVYAAVAWRNWRIIQA